MRKINVLHTIDSNETGGAETVFLQLIEYLNTDKYNFIIVLSGHGWLYTKVTEMGYFPIVLNTDGSFLFNYLISLIKIYKTHKIDLVHSHLLGTNLYASIAGMICRVPVISTFHGDADLSSDDALLRLKLRMINVGSKKIVFVSKHLKNFVLSKFSLKSNKLNVVYNGINLNKWSHDCTKNEKLKESLGFRKNHFLIGSIGDVRPPKGYHMLLEAAVDVLNHTPECRFVIAGNTETETYNDLLKLQKDLGLDDKVHFLGFRDDVWALLKIFDVFLLPSISEGFSISTVEAMASGAPVVATKSGGPTEIITNGIDGILVDSADPLAIANGIIKLISNDNLRTTLAQNAKETAHKRFSIQYMIRSYEELYAKLISE